jgi:hypothetical protein
MVTTATYKYLPSFATLWEFLAADEHLINVISEIPFSKVSSSPSSSLIEIKAQYIPEPEEEFKFMDPLVIYRDKDLLQSLCINPVSHETHRIFLTTET